MDHVLAKLKRSVRYQDDIILHPDESLMILTTIREFQDELRRQKDEFLDKALKESQQGIANILKTLIRVEGEDSDE